MRHRLPNHMSAKFSPIFKIASEPEEMEAIHRLNHRTFAEEIPQHATKDDGRLVDKFHDNNVYLIAVHETRLIGMVALRIVRPFSLDGRLQDLDSFLPPGRRWCEIRLLAVEKEFRFSSVTTGLMTLLAQEAIRLGFDAAVISGTTRQLKLYRHIGFKEFGPLVGTEGAMYQPMWLSLEALQEQASLLLPKAAAPRVANFLPGPVAMRPEVKTAFSREPESHRSVKFLADLADVKRHLKALSSAKHVELMTGSGTLANEIIAAQIKLLEAPGIIISQGEFGERLADQGRRIGLNFHHFELPWGEALNEAQLVAALDSNPAAKWLWTTHCETSTGQLNDLSLLQKHCDPSGVKLCLDCISTLGLIPLDLSNVYLASAASGKGLASYPGIAMVFHNHEVVPQPEKLPRYLDLGLYAHGDGVPFTLNSNLLYALQAALKCTDWKEKSGAIERRGKFLRQTLASQGHEILGCEKSTNPAVLTIAIPHPATSRNLGHQLQTAGFLLSHQSNYLLQKNWLQICLMGDILEEDVERLAGAMAQFAGERFGTGQSIPISPAKNFHC